MDPLARAVEAANGPWPVLAIFILCFSVLTWKLAIPLLRMTRESHEATEQIKQDIVTNHGSKNIGDAIDRLTEWMLQHLEESRTEAAQVADLRREFVVHLVDSGESKAGVTEALARLDERLGQLENKSA
jgi:hypothetical protein